MENKNIINIGLVGCGRISSKHIFAIDNIKNAKIIALCDVDIGKAKKIKDKLSVDKIYKNYRC